MGDETIERFTEERSRLDDLVMKYARTNIKRFYNIDHHVYESGALPAKTKELIGLVASFVLRCDDCILYHLMRCQQEGVTDSELEEALAIGLIVGGSITIPHLRRSIEVWDEMKNNST